MKFTKEQIEKAKSANSKEELLAMAKDNNIEMTIEEVDKYFNSLNNTLSDEELNNVTGGCGSDPKYHVGFRFGTKDMEHIKDDVFYNHYYDYTINGIDDSQDEYYYNTHIAYSKTMSYGAYKRESDELLSESRIDEILSGSNLAYRL